MHRVEYRCRITLEPEELNIALISFLKQKVNISEKDKVLSALSGYWLPFALRENGNYSQEQLKYYALSAIYKLKLHIALLSETFALEECFLNNPINIVEPKSIQTQVVVSEKLNHPDDALNIDIVHHQDDKTFEEMFI